MFPDTTAKKPYPCVLGNAIGDTNTYAGTLDKGTVYCVVVANRNCLDSTTISIDCADSLAAFTNLEDTTQVLGAGEEFTLAPGDGRLFL